MFKFFLYWPCVGAFTILFLICTLVIFVLYYRQLNSSCFIPFGSLCERHAACALVPSEIQTTIQAWDYKLYFRGLFGLQRVDFGMQLWFLSLKEVYGKAHTVIVVGCAAVRSDFVKYSTCKTLSPVVRGFHCPALFKNKYK